jgi:hypothetical protein
MGKKGKKDRSEGHAAGEPGKRRGREGQRDGGIARSGGAEEQD